MCIWQRKEEDRCVSRAVVTLHTFYTQTRNKKKSEWRLIIFLSISKCRGACREVKELERGEQSAQKVRKLPSSPVTGVLGSYPLKLFFCHWILWISNSSIV